MARYLGPVCRLCRREGEKLFLKGQRCFSPKCSFEKRSYVPGAHGKTGSRGSSDRESDYARQLRAKQKARRIYGVLEAQFRRYYEIAQRSKGVTGALLLSLLESRLDNVIFRLGLATSRAQARQLVAHGHIDVNGRRTKSPSYLCKAGDAITVHPASLTSPYFKNVQKEIAEYVPPKWLSLDPSQMSGKVHSRPNREEIDLSLNEQLIVEYYSR